MRHFLLIVIILTLLHQYQFGQKNTKNHVIGSVINSNGEAIHGVNIYSKNGRGAITDKHGLFEFITAQDTILLTFSHIGYLTAKKDVLFRKNIDTLYIKIKLHPKIEKLEEINVTSNNTDLFYKDKGIIILDFDISKNGLKILYKSNWKYYLRVKNDSCSLDWKINFKPTKFFQDCFGNTHIISKDSVYQIYVDHRNFYIISVNHINKFNELLRSCDVSLPQKLIFSELGNYKQNKIIYSIDKITHKKQPIKKIEYKIGTLYASELRRDLIRCYMSIAPETQNMILLGVWDGDVNSLNIPDNTFFVKLSYYKSIATKPIYCPVFSYNDGFLIFNHIENKIEHYDQKATFLYSEDIDYSNSNDWNNNIIKDNNERFYAEFIKNGIITLKRINVETGKTENYSTISKYTFPQRIQIYDDIIYFMIKNRVKNEFEIRKIKI